MCCEWRGVIERRDYAVADLRARFKAWFFAATWREMVTYAVSKSQLFVKLGKWNESIHFDQFTSRGWLLFRRRFGRTVLAPPWRMEHVCLEDHSRKKPALWPILKRHTSFHITSPTSSVMSILNWNIYSTFTGAPLSSFQRAVAAARPPD